ncbi:putative ABC transport system permease protein [Agromyces hippuratus]|uniref:Putative ABC transport system permease protein n=1 Tax=Agromyces hippuratus TaxID=286438 RepID=A0A852WN52_9MICO|nr:ABC transporter permease [Agromyces hippuratus]NYG19552.1 putative ABC transport system permease protein [Agromyces hippuratus]
MMGWLTRTATGVVSTIVEALEELRIHRGRVLLSLIGVAVAVCALTTVVGAGAIAEQAGREMQERGGGRPATVQLNPMSQNGSIDPETADAAWRAALERHGIEYASRVGYGGLTVQFADGAVPVSMQVVDPDYGLMHRVRLSEGSWFVDRDADRLAPALIVNEAFWKRLGSPALDTHPTVQLLGRGAATGVVTGVTPAQGEWDTEPTAFILSEGFLPLQPATPDPMMGAYAPAYEMWIPDGSADELTESMKQAFQSELGDGATVDGWRSDYGAMGGDPFLPLKLMVIGVAVVILLLGALGLLTIALVTVRGRIREIGIRRSFGATAGRVFFSVLMETVVGTFVAGVVGVGAAIAIVRSPLMGMALGGADVQDMPGFPIEAALIGIGAAVAVGALAGLLPALGAVRVKVIDAIRF